MLAASSCCPEQEWRRAAGGWICSPSGWLKGRCWKGRAAAVPAEPVPHTPPQAAPRSPRVPQPTEGPGGVTVKRGLKGLYTSTRRACNRPGHQTGPNTSFKGKATVQTCVHVLVHASSTLPYHCRTLLPPCLPPFPTSSFVLLLLPTDLFLPPLEEALLLPMTYVGRSLGAKAPKPLKSVQAGECKGRLIYFLFQVFSKDYFRHLNGSHSHDPVSERAGSPGASRRALYCQRCSAVSRRRSGFPRSKLITRQGFKGSVITRCLVHWTTAAWSCFPGIFFFTLNKTQLPLSPTAPTCRNTTMMLLRTRVVLPQK